MTKSHIAYQYVANTKPDLAKRDQVKLAQTL